MALDKSVDSAVLDANLTAVADAIREKGGTEDALAFPDGFVSAIAEIDGSSLPTLTNPAGADQILEGYEAIDGSGNKLTGTHVCESGGGGGEWMNFCADETTWTGESLSFSMTAVQKYSGKVILSPIGQYRFTVDGTEYIATDSDITKNVAPNGCPLMLSASRGTYTLSDMITETNVARTVKVESWTGTTQYTP